MQVISSLDITNFLQPFIETSYSTSIKGYITQLIIQGKEIPYVYHFHEIEKDKSEFIDILHDWVSCCYEYEYYSLLQNIVDSAF